MTHPETIRDTLARLWDTDATAYDMAWAILKAADIDSDDLEVEVESVITRAQLARELVDLAKVAAQVAKLLPGVATELKPEAPRPLPLCEAILAEIDSSGKFAGTQYQEGLNDGLNRAARTVGKHFAALKAEEMKASIRTGYMQRGPHGSFDIDEEQAAQAVMRLLRKE